MIKKIRLILYLVLLIIIQLFISFTWGIRPIMLQATTYNNYVDYSEYLVNNFNDYSPILKSTTSNLDYYLKVEGSFDYSFNSCPVIGGIMADISLANRVSNSLGVSLDSNDTLGGHLYCSQAYETYSFSMSIPLQETADFTDFLLNIDDNYIYFNNFFRFKGVPQSYGVQLTISNWLMRQWLEIDFNNTYLMSTFLLESDYVNTSPLTNTINRPFVLYAETATDRYNVYNDNLSLSLENRYKYAITIPNIETALVVNKIGTGWESKKVGNHVITLSSTTQYTQFNWGIYTLNASPMPTPFDDTVIDTAPNYAICDYSLFGWPVDCTINNVPVNSFQAMGNDIWEWLSKESPIFGDIWTLASAGFQWFGNMFQFLSDFDPLSLLGGMLTILMGVLLLGWAFKGG